MRLLFIIILFLMIPIAYGIEECSRTNQNTKDIPCSVVSSYKPTTGCDQTVSIFLTNETSNSTYIFNAQWEDTIPFCQFVFNITDPLGTYVYNSSIESGMVTLQRENNMLAIIFVFMFMAGGFFLIGYQNPQGFVKFTTYGLGLLELLMMVWMIWINEAGFSVINLLKLNAMICLILGGLFGIYSIFWQTTKFIPIGEQTQFEEDSFAKWTKRRN